MMKKYFIISIILLATALSSSAQSEGTRAQWETIDGQEVSVKSKKYSVEFFAGNYSSTRTEQAIIRLYNPQKMVIGELKFYSSSSRIWDEDASRDANSGLITAHFHVNYFDYIYDLVKSGATIELKYNKDTEQASLSTNVTSNGAAARGNRITTYKNLPRSPK